MDVSGEGIESLNDCYCIRLILAFYTGAGRSLYWRVIDDGILYGVDEFYGDF